MINLRVTTLGLCVRNEGRKQRVGRRAGGARGSLPLLQINYNSPLSNPERLTTVAKIPTYYAAINLDFIVLINEKELRRIATFCLSFTFFILNVLGHLLMDIAYPFELTTSLT